MPRYECIRCGRIEAVDVMIPDCCSSCGDDIIRIADDKPITSGQRAAIAAYAAEHIPNCKRHLVNDWMASRTSGILQRLRTTHGASSLRALRLEEPAHDPLAALADIDHAAEACRILIQAYSKNPEQVDWSDVQDALLAALNAFALPEDCPNRAHEARLAAEEERDEIPSPPFLAHTPTL